MADIAVLSSLIQALCDTLIEQETQQVTLSFSDFGQSYSGLSGKSAEDFGDGYPFITYMNVYQNQIIDLTDVGLVKINETEQQSVVRHGDILLTLSSETPEEVGMGAVYLGETYPLYLNSFCFGIHIIDEAKIYPPFLAYYVSSQSFRKAVYPLAQGSTRFNLQKSDFMKKKFSFPVIEKQQKIYSILNSYSDKLIVERQIMKSLCYQKCYLLRQLFI
jgi:restriction endonuclease S subunit